MTAGRSVEMSHLYQYVMLYLLRQQSDHATGSDYNDRMVACFIPNECARINYAHVFVAHDVSATAGATTVTNLHQSVYERHEN